MVEFAGVIITSAVRVALVVSAFVVFATIAGAEFGFAVNMASVVTLAVAGLVVARYA